MIKEEFEKDLRKVALELEKEKCFNLYKPSPEDIKNRLPHFGGWEENLSIHYNPEKKEFSLWKQEAIAGDFTQLAVLIYKGKNPNVWEVWDKDDPQNLKEWFLKAIKQKFEKYMS